MRFWWVNQNQTARHEFAGGYLWSPKRNSNGARNHFYETMREVSPGDIVFSFVDTRIAAIGIAESHCYESPKPQEFGNAGQNWENIGWRVRVQFSSLLNRIRPKDHIDILRSFIPSKYSPLLPNGNGLQSVYLAEISDAFAQTLSGLIGLEATVCIQEAVAMPAGQVIGAPDDLELWESRIEQTIESDMEIPATDRRAIVNARRGQGLFKQRVMKIEERCRVTGVNNPLHLVASHCKPWRDATNKERLDGENGLLLTPSIDHLFDRGFISFENGGQLVISPVAHRPSLQRMGIAVNEAINVGAFSEGQRRYLDFHRDAVLLKVNA